MTDNDQIVLYCLMRTDLASLNTGKAIAQGMHAANKMAWEVRRHGMLAELKLLETWEDESAGQGFGTTITLGVVASQMYLAVELALGLGLRAAVVRDDTYPLRDGKVMHFFPLDTCAYIFGPKSVAQKVLNELDLHP